MTMTRITYYQDPIGDQEWIVASDNGDASEETVLADYATEAEAEARAEQEAERRGVAAIYLPSQI